MDVGCTEDIMDPPCSSDPKWLAAVYRDPESLEARRRCGLSLIAAGDTRGELVLSALEPPRSDEEHRRIRMLYRRHLTAIKAPFHRSGVGGMDSIMVDAGFASTLLLRTPPLGVPSLEWATVHTIELRGAPRFLLRPELAWVRRVIVSAEDVIELARHQALLPFKSIVIDDHHDEATWKAFAGPAFLNLVEIQVQTFSAWLPAGAQRLLWSRPEITVRSASRLPADDPRALVPLDARLQVARRALWAAGLGIHFDNWSAGDAPSVRAD